MYLSVKRAQKKRRKKKRLRKFFSACVYASSVHAYSRLAYNAPSRMRVRRVVQRVCAHADRAACVRACMNAHSSISDAYKCAPSVSRPRVLSHDKTLSDARAYAFGSYRVPSRLHCPLELYCFLVISTPPSSSSFSHMRPLSPSASLFSVGDIKRLSNS